MSEEVVYIINGLLFSHEKEWEFAICNKLGRFIIGILPKRWKNSGTSWFQGRNGLKFGWKIIWLRKKNCQGKETGKGTDHSQAIKKYWRSGSNEKE